MNFFKTPFLLKALFPGLLWEIKNEGTNTIYLTFDDGPVPDITPFVLKTLSQYKAKATFFCVGENIAKYPGIFMDIETEGHRTGNHTYHHLNGWEVPSSHYLKNVEACHLTLAHNRVKPAEPATPLFRPPYGRMRIEQWLSLRQKYQIVMWDILSGDYDSQFSEQVCLQKSIKASKPGTIIIFHDSYKAAKNLKYVLPRYLDYFASSGYNFATL